MNIVLYDLPLELTRELRRATDTLEAVHRTEGLRNKLYSSRKEIKFSHLQ